MKNKRTYTFKKVDGTIIDNVREYVTNWVKENPYGTVTIGCDSQEHAKYIKYAVSIVMHYRKYMGNDKKGNPIYSGHGGHVINAVYTDYSRNMKSDIFTKLFVESEIVVEIAQMIGDLGKKLTIHLDYNSKEEEYSHVLYNQGIGFVQSMGYEVYGKPHAWAASHTADRVAKSGRKS